MFSSSESGVYSQGVARGVFGRFTTNSLLRAVAVLGGVLITGDAATGGGESGAFKSIPPPLTLSGNLSWANSGFLSSLLLFFPSSLRKNTPAKTPKMVATKLTT